MKISEILVYIESQEKDRTVIKEILHLHRQKIAGITDRNNALGSI